MQLFWPGFELGTLLKRCRTRWVTKYVPINLTLNIICVKMIYFILVYWIQFYTFVNINFICIANDYWFTRKLTMVIVELLGSINMSCGVCWSEIFCEWFYTQTLQIHGLNTIITQEKLTYMPFSWLIEIINGHKALNNTPY